MQRKDFWEKLSASGAFLTGVASVLTAWVAISAVRTTNEIFDKVVKIQEHTERIETLMRDKFSQSVAEKLDAAPTTPDELKEKVESAKRSIKLENLNFGATGHPVWEVPPVSESDYKELSSRLNDAKSQGQKKEILNDFFNRR
jgi:hypothetical protein